MNATISKNLMTNKYVVTKWDSDGNIIDEFYTAKKHIAHEVFDKWYFNKK